jgi:hypothetical protein
MDLAQETTMATKGKATTKDKAKPKAAGIGKPRLRILKALSATPKGLTRGELAKAADVDPCAVGGLAGYTDPKINSRPVHAGNLLNQGLVALKSDPERGTVFSITAAGRKALTEGGTATAASALQDRPRRARDGAGAAQRHRSRGGGGTARDRPTRAAPRQEGADGEGRQDGGQLMDPLTPMPETLEAFVDRHGLDRVLEALERICYAKADHLRTNWQDAPAAKTWERAATKIGVAVVTARNTTGGCR